MVQYEADFLRSLSDEQLAAETGFSETWGAQQAQQEWRRRELQIQREVASVQSEVASAQIRAANWTRWSVLAIAISVAVAAIGIWLEWLTAGSIL
ncbi:MAG: hypothetical protein HRU33_25620 [Rhodobacteraceae bacterium]|nr:hypothetical protein [Paracoccaceae bacterium]